MPAHFHPLSLYRFSPSFVEGRWSEDSEADGPSDQIAIRSFLPHVPAALLWPEVLRWGGAHSGAVWPGECTGALQASETDTVAFSRLINEGVEHMAVEHVSQALSCWR
jgi:hypothetical protein